MSNSSKGSFYTQNTVVGTDTNPAGPADTPVSPNNTPAPSSFYKGTGTPGSPTFVPGANVVAFTPVPHEFLTGLSGGGAFSAARPSFADISGQIDPSQIPPAGLMSFGGVDAILPVTHQWVQYINTSGQQILSQPAFSDIAGTINYAQLTTAIQGITFNRLAKTAAYSVVNGDKGNTIALGGNALYTLTLNAASGYDANFSVNVVNEDAGRAKWISLASGSFYLWPGQSVLVYNSNNVWRTVGAPSRWVLQNNLTINVDPVNGSDVAGVSDGLGLTTGAFKTFQGALVATHRYLDCNNNQITILNASGATDSTGVHVPYWGLVGGQGGAGITLDLNGGTITCTGDWAVDTYFGMQFSIRNGTIGTSSGGGVTAQRGARVQIEDSVTFGPVAPGYAHMFAANGGVIMALNPYSIAGGGAFHIQCGAGGTVAAAVAVTLVGAANSITFTGNTILCQGGQVSAPSSWTNAAAINAGTTVNCSIGLGGEVSGASSVPGSTGSNSNLTGDVTTNISDGATISANVVSNVNLAQMPANTIKGNNTGSTANAADLTTAQVAAILPAATVTTQGLKKEAAPFKAALTSAQTIAASTTAKLTLNTVITNSGSFYDGTTNYRWTPPAGPVCITAAALASSFDSANPFSLKLVKNGETWTVAGNLVTGQVAVNGLGTQYASLTFFDVANGTDWYELGVTNNSSTTSVVLGANNQYTYFSGIALQ